MNELELIFTLLEEDDIIYNKDLTSQKKSRLATMRISNCVTGIKQDLC